MAQMTTLDPQCRQHGPNASTVFYFPQGHAEHSAQLSISPIPPASLPPYSSAGSLFSEVPADHVTDEAYPRSCWSYSRAPLASPPVVVPVWMGRAAVSHEWWTRTWCCTCRDVNISGRDPGLRSFRLSFGSSSFGSFNRRPGPGGLTSDLPKTRWYMGRIRPGRMN
ncbi:hypothetical protein SAY87_019533 [Trapa incisa]|uniref:Uncharacterized protein n=1 Tax=Trapa incisa TaxID=236973 RepID=A0AAN7K2J2_9MYRT|nr:hypothetical protein SAY87_019533 [Trapa incisa]